MWINYTFLAFIGFSTGIIVAGGVFAFITIIGIVPRLIQKTNTHDWVRLYEDVIIFGGLFGVACELIEGIQIPIGLFGSALYGIFTGMFVGSLAVSLAEVLNVIPILTRRMNLHVGMSYFIVSLAIGKMIGSLFYYLIPGFPLYGK